MKESIVTLAAVERLTLLDLIAAGKAAAMKLAHARKLLKADAAARSSGTSPGSDRRETRESAGTPDGHETRCRHCRGRRGSARIPRFPGWGGRMTIGPTFAGDLIRRIYDERRIPLEGGGSTPLNIYIPPEQGELLQRLVREFRPEATVEVGMANGLSTLFLASALEDHGRGRHVAIDPFQSTDWKNVGVGLMRIAGLSGRVELREDFSHRALVDLDREGYRPGLAFIDGAHTFDHTMADFLLADRIVPVGGVVAFDDSDWPAVTAVIRYVLANRDYEVVPGLPVIEPPPGRPGLAARAARRLVGSSGILRRAARPAWLRTDEELGIAGRCVVLRKKGEDRRDTQDRDGHRPF